MEMMNFSLKPVPPFRLDLTVWVLRRAPVNMMDRWDGKTYRRVLVFDDVPAEVSIEQIEAPKAANLKVNVKGLSPTAKNKNAVISELQKILGLNIDLAPFYKLASTNKKLEEIVSRFMGFKPIRLPSIFETLLNAIACQQVSLNVGLLLLNRLCVAYGLSFENQHAFVHPKDLINAQPADLRKIGFSYRKSEYILGIARGIVEGQLDLEGLAELDDESIIAKLRQIHGVGRWTAEYGALRGFGRLNVFPADDTGAQAKFKEWLRLRKQPDYDRMYKTLNKWKPYRGLVYFYLLLEHQNRLGLH
jgi:DNA-3-methyladenine glycosylase II